MYLIIVFHKPSEGSVIIHQLDALNRSHPVKILWGSVLHYPPVGRIFREYLDLPVRSWPRALRGFMPNNLISWMFFPNHIPVNPPRFILDDHHSYSVFILGNAPRIYARLFISWLYLHDYAGKSSVGLCSITSGVVCWQSLLRLYVRLSMNLLHTPSTMFQ